MHVFQMYKLQNNFYSHGRVEDIGGQISMSFLVYTSNSFAALKEQKSCSLENTRWGLPLLASSKDKQIFATPKQDESL